MQNENRPQQESAEKERIQISFNLGQMETRQIQTLEKLGLLDPDESSNKVLQLSAEQRDNLQEFINLLLLLRRRIRKRNKRWKQRHTKACADVECQKMVNRHVDECPECGLPTKWWKTDEKGQPTDVETEKTPPPQTLEEGFPILHNDACQIVDVAQNEVKQKLIDRATSKSGETRYPELDQYRRVSRG